MVDEAMLLMSLQHAHVDGPWQAMSGAIQQHFDNHHQHHTSSNSSLDHEHDVQQVLPVPTFQVLDLACGPRGEPGTTIAHLLPVRT
jgi:hypothetical protein